MSRKINLCMWWRLSAQRSVLDACTLSMMNGDSDSICKTACKQDEGEADLDVADSVEINHQCDICSKSFTQAEHLKQHLFVHSCERNNQCHICHKKFTTAGSLKRHLLGYTGLKDHKCSLCDKAFKCPSLSEQIT